MNTDHKGGAKAKKKAGRRGKSKMPNSNNITRQRGGSGGLKRCGQKTTNERHKAKSTKPRRCNEGSWPMFATGRSVRPGPGRGRTTLCRPTPSPTVPHCPRSSPVVPAVFGCSQMFSAVSRRALPSPLSPAVLWSYLPSPGKKLSQVVGLAVLANDRHPGN